MLYLSFWGELEDLSLSLTIVLYLFNWDQASNLWENVSNVTKLNHTEAVGGEVFRYSFCVSVLDIIYTRSSQVHLPTIEQPVTANIWPTPDWLRFSGAAGQEMRVDTMREIQPVIVRCHESWQVSSVGRGGRASVYHLSRLAAVINVSLDDLGRQSDRDVRDIGGRDLNCH